MEADAWLHIGILRCNLYVLVATAALFTAPPALILMVRKTYQTTSPLTLHLRFHLGLLGISFPSAPWLWRPRGS